MNKQGAALMTVMIILGIVATTVALLVPQAKQQAYAVTRVRDYLKAQAYPEAGANQAYSLLKTNFTLRTDPSRFPLTTYGDGEYDATVTAIDTNKASISCTGKRGKAIVNTMVDLQNFPLGTPNSSTSNIPPAVGALGYAIAANGKVTFSGNGTFNTGGSKIHGDNTYNMTGSKQVIGNISSSIGVQMVGATKVTGNVSAPTINAPVGSVNGVTTAGSVPLVNMPDIDFTPYYNMAIANGQIVNGNLNISGSTPVVPVGGVIWVNGNIKYSGSGNLVGSFIATGDIDISGSGNQIKVGNLPAFVSLNGGIDITGSGSSHGLIYSRIGNFDKSGNGVHTGTIVAGGDVTGSGGWSAITYENSTPTLPAGYGNNNNSAGDRVGVIAWQK